MRRLLALTLVLPLLAACSPEPEEDAADPLPPFAEVCLLTDEQASEVLGAPARSEDRGSSCHYTAGDIVLDLTSSKLRAPRPAETGRFGVPRSGPLPSPRTNNVTIDGVPRAQASLSLLLPDRRLLISALEPGRDSPEARERAIARVTAAGRLLETSTPSVTASPTP